MKKYALLLPLMAMVFAFTACTDDDDLPQVDIAATYTGAKMVDGTLYIVQDSEFSVTSVTATAVREGKKAAITFVVYGIDGWDIGGSDTAPFTIVFDPGTFRLGKHLLSMDMGIAEVGCEFARGYYATEFIVVASADDIPQSGDSTEQGIIRTRPSIQQ